MTTGQVVTPWTEEKKGEEIPHLYTGRELKLIIFNSLKQVDNHLTKQGLYCRGDNALTALTDGRRDWELLEPSQECLRSGLYLSNLCFLDLSHPGFLPYDSQAPQSCQY